MNQFHTLRLIQFLIEEIVAAVQSKMHQYQMQGQEILFFDFVIVNS
jgi:hypothetical protein